MDKIEFSIGDVVIQLVEDRIRIWNGTGEISETPDADLPIKLMRDVMNVANMLNLGWKHA